MKTAPSQHSLTSFDRIAHARGPSTLAIGAMLIAVWAGGHGALYGAYRTAPDHPTETVVAQAR